MIEFDKGNYVVVHLELRLLYMKMTLSLLIQFASVLMFTG